MEKKLILSSGMMDLCDRRSSGWRRARKRWWIGTRQRAQSNFVVDAAPVAKLVGSDVEKPLDLVLRMAHVFDMKTAAVHSRIQPEIKQRAEDILHRLGLSPTEAIRMFYTQITLRNGLPFDVAIPNEETVKALEDSMSGKNLERFNSVDELFESWES